MNRSIFNTYSVKKIIPTILLASLYYFIMKLNIEVVSCSTQKSILEITPQSLLSSHIDLESVETALQASADRSCYGVLKILMITALFTCVTGLFYKLTNQSAKTPLKKEFNQNETIEPVYFINSNNSQATFNVSLRTNSSDSDIFYESPNFPNTTTSSVNISPFNSPITDFLSSIFDGQVDNEYYPVIYSNIVFFNTLKYFWRTISEMTNGNDVLNLFYCGIFPVILDEKFASFLLERLFDVGLTKYFGSITAAEFNQHFLKNALICWHPKSDGFIIYLFNPNIISTKLLPNLNVDIPYIWFFSNAFVAELMEYNLIDFELNVSAYNLITQNEELKNQLLQTLQNEFKYVDTIFNAFQVTDSKQIIHEFSNNDINLYVITYKTKMAVFFDLAKFSSTQL
jgi:hypothetical protein